MAATTHQLSSTAHSSGHSGHVCADTCVVSLSGISQLFNILQCGLPDFLGAGVDSWLVGRGGVAGPARIGEKQAATGVGCIPTHIGRLVMGVVDMELYAPDTTSSHHKLGNTSDIGHSIHHCYGFG